LPVLIGIALRKYYPQLVERYDKTLRSGGILLLMALIAFVLFQTWDLFLTSWFSIAQAAAVFVLLSMLLGWIVGFLFRWDRKDSFTLSIEYGVRNVAIASTAAVVLLKRTEFATFAATYFLVEAFLILLSIHIVRKFHS